MPEFPSSFLGGTAEIPLLEKGLSAPCRSSWTQKVQLPLPPRANISISVKETSKLSFSPSFIPSPQHSQLRVGGCHPCGDLRGAGMGREFPGSFSALLLTRIPGSLSRLPSCPPQQLRAVAWHRLNSCIRWLCF